MYGGNIMTTRPPFHEQLRYEREKRGWSQADLAGKVGCDTKTIGRWENGDSVPRPYHRQALYEIFGKDAEEFGLMEEKRGNSQLGEVSGQAGQAQGPHLSAPPPLVPTTSTMDAPSQPLEGIRVALASPRADWGEAPSIVNLYGRDEECARLKRWI